MSDRRHVIRIEDRDGFTLVEVIVSIGVIGLLMALLLPAIQRVRESSRAVECKSHLHQIGIAVHNHCEKSGGKLPHTHLPLTKLLPLVDMASLADYLDRGTPPSQSVPSGPALYVCPSDPQASTEKWRTSYPINWGTKILSLNGMVASHGSGTTFDGHPTNLADITDGLSATAMFSEQLVRVVSGPSNISVPMAKQAPLRHVWKTGRDFTDGHELELAAYCLDPVNHNTATLGGYFGTATLGAESPYNHIAPANSWSFHIPGESLYGAFAPSSNHPGGVHVLLADGSVRFVSSSIGLPVWWALGSRNGNESVGEF